MMDEAFKIAVEEEVVDANDEGQPEPEALANVHTSAFAETTHMGCR
jgi:hypothetical protein